MIASGHIGPIHVGVIARVKERSRSDRLLWIEVSVSRCSVGLSLLVWRALLMFDCYVGTRGGDV